MMPKPSEHRKIVTTSAWGTSKRAASTGVTSKLAHSTATVALVSVDLPALIALASEA